ncbi:MAG: M23 family metallopeptidase [Treponema sp.]|nr:M23 family metallopeptidase [Treponema sp.]
MKKLLLPLFALFTLINIPLFSIDWPSREGVLNRNFGVNNNGLPHLGLSFDTAEEIYAAAGGELLFNRRRGDTASRLPSPLGAWIAVDHGDGIISIYSRLSDSTQDLMSETEGRVSRGMHLGTSGISGWSSGRGFYFKLYDRAERRWINPMVIAALPADTRLPDILSIRLIDSEGTVYLNPSQGRNLNQGLYTIIVDAFDTIRTANESPLAPFRITCILNGREAGTLNFESYSARDGSLTVQRNGLIPVRQVYAPFPAYEIAEIWLSRGQTSLEIIAQDVSGNTRNMSYRFIVE